MFKKKRFEAAGILCLILVLLLTGCSTAQSTGTQSLDIDYVGEDGEITEEEVTAGGGSMMEWLRKKLSSDKKDADAAVRGEPSSEEEEGSILQEYYGLADDSGGTAEPGTDADRETEDQADTPADGQPAQDDGQTYTPPSGDNPTLPVTDGSQEPSQNGGQAENKTPVPGPETKKNTVTFTIRCDTAVANGMHKEAKWAGIVPASGCILPVITMEFEDGETVFDLLCRIRDTYKLQMEYSGANGGEYIEGINNLYEFDGGRWSGWMYCVNDWYPNYGCGQYKVSAGDVIEWNYTCDLGCDLENGDPYGYGQEWKDTHD